MASPAAEAGHGNWFRIFFQSKPKQSGVNQDASAAAQGTPEQANGPVEAPSKRRNCWEWYMTMLFIHPVKTKALTAGFINLIGDIICQLGVEKHKNLEAKRLFIFFFLGLAVVGPVLHFWYLALHKYMPVPGLKGALMRLVTDQLVYSPPFVAVFFILLLTLEGRPKAIGHTLKKTWWPTVLTNWKIWVPFQFINFLFVPQLLQVAAANIVSLGWNIYLSYATHES